MWCYCTKFSHFTWRRCAEGEGADFETSSLQLVRLGLAHGVLCCWTYPTIVSLDLKYSSIYTRGRATLQLLSLPVAIALSTNLSLLLSTVFPLEMGYGFP